MKARYPVIALGVAIFGFAIAAILAPDVGAGLPIASAVDRAGSDYQLVSLFGVFAFLVILAVMALRAIGGTHQATPPDPERIQTAPRPGSGFDAVVDDGIGFRERFFGDREERIKERLRRTAAQLVMERDSCGREDAIGRIERGTWTENRTAAAFIAGPEGPSPGVESRVRAAIGGNSWVQYGAKHTADEIARQAGVEQNQ